MKCKNCLIIKIVAYPVQLNKDQDLSEHFKLFPQRLHRLGDKKCPNLSKNVSFLKFTEKLLFERVSTVQKFFNYHLSYTSIGTQIRAHSLKVSRHSDHKGDKIFKNGLKWTKSGSTNTLVPKKSSKHLKSRFSVNHTKSNLSSYCGLDFSLV